MSDRASLPSISIGCGTALVIAALILVGHQMSLAAADVAAQRVLSYNLLHDSTVERVTLSEWEPPSMSIAWAALIGGFGLVAIGILKAFHGRSTVKAHLKDDFE